MQERHNSIANQLELRLSCINPSIYFPLQYGLNTDSGSMTKEAAFDGIGE